MKRCILVHTLEHLELEICFSVGGRATAPLDKMRLSAARVHTESNAVGNVHGIHSYGRYTVETKLIMCMDIIFEKLRTPQ